ncbi:MAG: mechanosensitive ion channel family protein [Propionibacteriaceae bacterium]|jgi:small conductance mechanosensitive channel|nr:mechanosensitive ion channel family protein [Propionibacteriaceae bacterium]
MNQQEAFIDVQKMLLIGLVILVSFIARWAIVRIIKISVRRVVRQSRNTAESSTRAGRILAAATGANSERHEQRITTLGTLMRSIVTFVILIIAITTILALLNVPVAPLLASAGVGGIALGFGAQSLVKDFLAGIAMIIEDQYGVGDLIDTGELVGTVEDVGLRVTRMRDAAGQVWYVRNGEILRVGNHSQGWSTAIADIPISPDEDINKAMTALETVADALDQDKAFADVLLDKPTVIGVNAMTPIAMTLRIIAKTAPNQHWAVQRAMLERSQQALAAVGISPAIHPIDTI